MKVNIGPYNDYIGPYQIVQKIFFWKEWYSIDDGGFAFRLADRLTEDKNGKLTKFSKLCKWIDSKRKRKVAVKVHHYDIWYADHTLALVIVPVLKQLKDQKQGWSNVDDKDVPEWLHYVADSESTDDDDIEDELGLQRFDWILDEIIWAFEQHCDDNWEDNYYSGVSDLQVDKTDGSDYGTLITGPNHTFKVDEVGKKKHIERMANGRRLFAKYYTSFWT